MPRRPSTHELALPRGRARLGAAAFYALLREAVLAGRLRPGTPVPSTRQMARDHGVARGTVVAAYEQLVLEGYFESRRGAGTRVSPVLPEALLHAAPAAGARAALTAAGAPQVLMAAGARLRRGRAGSAARPTPGRVAAGVSSPRGPGNAAQAAPSPGAAGVSAPAPAAAHATPVLSRRGSLFADTPFGVGSTARGAFVPHLPALDAFPLRSWAAITSRRARTLGAADLADGEAMGRRELREAVADYLGQARGVSCTAAQVLVLASVQQALDLATRVLLDAGDRVWVEDPGYVGAAALLRAAQLRPHAVPVDDEGLDVDAARRRCPRARLACVTPAHQAPLGVALSLPRRLALLDWARRSGAWIFEDDYDSEYRYAGRPLPALQSLDPAGPVLHAGCFSKTLFPALRIAYLVLPPALVPAFAAARSLTTRYPPVLEQLVLAEFMAEGHYARHLRRMRQLYAERRAALIAGLGAEVDGLLQVIDSPTGLNVAAWLRPGSDETRVVQVAARAGLVVQGLGGAYVDARARRPGLLLGFASLSLPAIRQAVRRLGVVLREASQGARTSTAQSGAG